MLYTKEELAYERSIGLELSDKENEAYNNDGTRNEEHFDTKIWTNTQFENFLNSKSWSEDIKNGHRKEFKGTITITFTSFGTIQY
jgi:hypothetical protein